MERQNKVVLQACFSGKVTRNKKDSFYVDSVSGKKQKLNQTTQHLLVPLTVFPKTNSPVQIMKT